MRIVFITHRIPYPARDGGLVATLYLLEELHRQGTTIKLLCINASRDENDISQIPEKFFTEYKMEYVDVDTRLKPLSALWNLLRGVSYNISRFNNDVFNKLVSKYVDSGDYDVIHFENLFSTVPLHFLNKNNRILKIVRTHNIEHLIWNDLSERAGNILKKKYLRILSAQLKKYEEKTLALADEVVPISSHDAEFLEKMHWCKNSYTATHGLKKEDFVTAENTPKTDSVFHLGSMDWMPNIEAMEWFTSAIWPLIRSKNSKAEFYMAGKNMPEYLLKLKVDGIHCLSFVEDIKAFYLDHQVMVVPLKSGSGIRIKILEGMAYGKAMVVTSKALEGIDAIHGKHLLVADTEEEFTNSTVQLLANPDLAKMLGENLKALGKEKYLLEDICFGLLNYYTRLLSNKE